MTACGWCGFPVMTRAVARSLELGRRTGRNAEPQGDEPYSLIAITVAVELDVMAAEVQRQIDDFAAAFDEWETRRRRPGPPPWSGSPPSRSSAGSLLWPRRKNPIGWPAGWPYSVK